MKDLITSKSTKTMTSLEISELVESRHDKVKQSVERLANRGIIELPPTGEISTATKPVKVYLLDKRSSLIVVAQLSPEFTARVVDRWQELEAQAAVPVFQLPQTLPEALRLAADLAEQNGNLQKQIEITQPKAEALDRIALANGNHCITNSAKVLQMRPKDLFSILNGQQWIYRRVGGKGWVAYQDKIQQGLLTHKITTVTDINTGIDKVVEHVLVTPKGLAKLSRLINSKAA